MVTRANDFNLQQNLDAVIQQDLLLLHEYNYYVSRIVENLTKLEYLRETDSEQFRFLLSYHDSYDDLMKHIASFELDPFQQRNI